MHAGGQGFKSPRLHHAASGAGFRDFPPPKSAEKAEAHPLTEAVEAFLLTKRVAGCTEATLHIYSWWLRRLLADAPEVSALVVRTFLSGLQSHSVSLQHQAYRTLKTFFRWCVETQSLAENPLRGFTMRTPKTLPEVPADEDLRAVLVACRKTLEGMRNRALLLVLADSGLRASEVLHLLIEDWRRAIEACSYAPARAARIGWPSSDQLRPGPSRRGWPDTRSRLLKRSCSATA